MTLNKLENFIKNTEGRILYVNPSDLDATDAIENQGNSLTKPFKTIQRALIEAARFSYLRGSDNDLIEKTTILIYPGEHVIDNRPGYAIKNVGGTATAVSPSGAETPAATELTLTTSSIFDLTQSNNILYKFNSINGGVVVPRGVSLVGLDLRKTKIRAKYVPNPTDSVVNSSAIFRVTGTCYFWQFTFLDGDESGTVYTDPVDFSSNNRSKPTFSHHKLTCFEYCDGVNVPSGYALTDLDMYYSKLSNAFNTESGRNIDQKYPASPLGFAKQRPEWEIVGAFASDPVNISTVISGDGFTPNTVVTVTTATDHGFNAGTPIKIKGVDVDDYNVSTKVQSVSSATQFTYVLPFVRANLPASPSASGATVTIETDTVTGASPYIFNCSLRSVWGMNGVHADGAKARGFRSLVTAQFTAVSLQKDDRSFVKYNKTSRLYEGLAITKVTGSALSNGSSSTDENSVYHLDSEAIYRHGWETSHIKASNDAFIQIVSIFAIGFTRHFDARTGSDFSVTNSNSNFGQISLAASGFKKEAFNKDDKGYITSVITPKAVTTSESNIDWISIDVNKTTSVGISSHLYLYGFSDVKVPPPVLTQGYRVGARVGDKLYVKNVGAGVTYSANIYMVDTDPASGAVYGTSSSAKEYAVTSVSSSVLTIGTHNLLTGEKIMILSDVGDLPENITPHRVYYTIKDSSTQIRLASSLTNAQNGTAITIYGGNQLRILSRVSDKEAGDVGSPVQYDTTNSQWYIHTESGSDIYTNISSLATPDVPAKTEVSFFKRTEDNRSIDEKLYKFRVVIPKEINNSKNPEEGFVIQESSTTGARTNSDFTLSSISEADYDYKRNPRFISTCSVSSSTITVVAELPHNLNVGDQIIVKNVTSTNNTAGTIDVGYNGTFEVTAVTNDKTFQYSTTDVTGVVHNPGSFTNNTSSRTTLLPRFSRNDWKGNFYIYRSDVITPYSYNVQDGVYHLYVLNASNVVPTEFTNSYFRQNITDLYPQLDRDNVNQNPDASKTFAKRAPIGEVVTSDLKKSLTRETTDKVLRDLFVGLPISGVSTSFTSATEGTATITFSREHNLSGIVTYSALTGGSGYTNGTYYNVKLFNNGTTTWDGATAKVVVSGGAVTNVDIIAGGSGYLSGETLDLDPTYIGGGSGAQLTLNTAGISTVVGNTVQITGIGTTAGGHFRITSVPAKNQVAVAITNGDARIVTDQYLINVGPEIRVSSSAYTSATGISTFTTARPHGLVIGNKIRVLNSTHANLGDYIISGITTTTISAVTNQSVSPLYVLKHGLSSNDKTSDVDGENLGARGFSFYDNEIMILNSNITNGTTLHVSLSNAGISTTKRFELGSYIQIDNEIMRIVTSTLAGAGNNEISVIRGALGTVKENHSAGSLIRKIKPRAVEFRRPSYVRASGHTFEYLGYGPGNYSTGLPQVQVRTLSEKEDYLAQAQEKSCGIVVYTGMNSVGDFFIGNKKINSATGKEVNFNIPVASITGEDPNRLSVVFDEVIVKERLLVEGGNSGQVLSQFDGPVTFNQELKMNDNVTMNGALKLNSTLNITDSTQSNSTTSGALTIKGGVGIGSNLNVGGTLTVGDATALNSTLSVTGNTTITSTTQSTSKDTGSLVLEGGAGIEKNVYVGGLLDVAGVSTFTGASTFANTLNVSGSTFVNALNINTSGAPQGDLYSNGGGDGTFNINNTTNSGITVFNNKNSSGTYNDILTLTSSSALIDGALNVTGDITAFYTSDQRLKDNIKPIEDPLAKVLSISGNTYTWNDKSGKEGTDVGVIAQEVLEVLPEAVTTRDNGYLAVDYQKLIPLMIEAIKDLKSEIDELKKSKG